MTEGLCTCGHYDIAHFDEVLVCGQCACERFWDGKRCPECHRKSWAGHKMDCSRKAA